MGQQKLHHKQQQHQQHHHHSHHHQYHPHHHPNTVAVAVGPPPAPTNSAGNGGNWPIPASSATSATAPPPLSAASSTGTNQSSVAGNYRHSTSSNTARPISGTTAAAATPHSTPASGSGGSGIRGFFTGRRSRSQQYQQLSHKLVDPQAPRLPLVYLSPPASPDSLNTTPEKVRIQEVNGKSASAVTPADKPPVPPVPQDIPVSKTISMMTNASVRNNRHSIQSTAASMSPRMRRRRRDPTPFNILVVGFLGSGKTSFVRFLKDSLGDSKRIRNVSQLANEEAAEQNVEDDWTQPPQKTHGFEKHYLEKEVDGERVGLTIFDSEGFGPREKNVVDIQLSLLINFITGKFEETFAEETKVQRSQKHLDTHIHCALYMIDPTSPHYHYSLHHGLDALDIHILSRLSRITTVIPIISKADTCTTTRMNNLKSLIAQTIRQQNLRLTSFLSESDTYSEAGSDDMDEDGDGDSMDLGDDLTLPLSILSPDYTETSEKKEVEGGNHVRNYPWGLADALNPLHCDYVKLRELIFVDWRRELRGLSFFEFEINVDYSRQVLYEHWRSNLMRSLTQ